MENIFIAIATENKEYGRALGLALLSVCRSFIIRLVSPSQLAEDWRPFDLVLIDEDVFRAKTRDFGDLRGLASSGSNIVYLTDRPQKHDSDEKSRSSCGNEFSIYKYLPAPSMVPMLFEFFEAMTGRQAVNIRTQDVQLYGFVSWAGGSGCTSVAAAFGQELCRYYGKKVLYVSLEEIESSGDMFECHEGVKNTGEYLYHMFKGEVPFIEAYILRDDYGMEAFAPVSGRNPLRNLDAEELLQFFSSVMDSGRFDVIIADIGNSLDESAAALMTIAGKLCMIKTGKQDVRENSWRQFVRHQCGEEILEKIVEFSAAKEKNEDAFAQHIKKLSEQLTENLTLN